MKAVNQLVRNGLGALDMRPGIAYHRVNNTRHASPRCAPGGFLVYGLEYGLQ